MQNYSFHIGYTIKIAGMYIYYQLNENIKQISAMDRNANNYTFHYYDAITFTRLNEFT